MAGNYQKTPKPANEFTCNKKAANEASAASETGECLKNLLFIPARVRRGEARPLLGEILRGKNRCHGADRNASAAINAFIGVDEKLLLGFVTCFIFARVDTVHRANVYASGV